MSTNIDLWPVIKCEQCPLARTRKNIVVGRGRLPCKYLFLGDGPGISEDIIGRPFLGGAGELLDTMIERAGLNPNDCAFTYCVLCRPCDGVLADNREPTRTEMISCQPNVSEIISIVAPRVIFLLGATTRTFYQRRLKEYKTVNLTHPAVLLRSGGMASPDIRENINKMRDVCLNTR